MHETPTFNLSLIYDTIEEAVIVDNEDANFSKTPASASVIVDNDDVNFSLSASNGGQWRYRTGSDQAYDGTYYYTRTYGDYTATWTPDLVAGEYVVSAMWREYSTRSTAVPYTINHAGGSTTVTVNQRVVGGKWIELGTFQFNGDPSENVTITHTRSGGSDTACADAIMFSTTGACWDWATSSEAYNNHYFWTPADGDYTATWTPSLSAAQWEVYARWDSDDTRSTAVPYTITHAGGSTTVTVNQRLGVGQWLLLGTFQFNGDPSENVTITYTRSGENDTVCADALKFVKDPFTIHIKRAHYYVWSAEQGKPYLVVVDTTIKYCAVDDANSNDTVEAGELNPIDEASVPSDVLCSRTYAEERQNFANWYSFYRRRELAAAAAVAKVIVGMQGVKMGFNSINGNLVQPALNVKVGAEDDTATLLDMLYGLTIQRQSTPLRRGLENVGKYYAGESGGIGNSPYADADNGGECQQAFTIVMTDGYWNGWDPSVGDADGDGNTDFDGSPYGDDYDNTLADVAMYYYENDLSALTDLVPTSPSDPATHQHMVTYTVSFGVTGNLNPDDYDLEVGPYPTWPDPEDGDQEKIDDLWHAAVNGRGEFLSASNPTELINSMQSIMSNIEGRIGSASSVSINGDELYEQLGADIRMFQATYFSDGWTGDVKAYSLDVTTGKVDMTSYLWSAAEELESVDWNSRVIATYDGSTGIPFSFDSLTADQKTQLDPNWQTDDTTARNMVNFLRGDDSNEQANGGTFRDRIHLDGRLQKLGDIVQSSPVYDNGMLYVGSNDGMLHAIDAETGTERFAYVPNLVFENLKYLSDPSYVHLFFVDLSPTVKDVTISGIDTLLVGGLGKGGRGYFALDVSNPSSITTEGILASKALWEFTDSTDLGYTYSKPALVKSNSATYEWIVIFGNGYNSEGGYAKLFILDASNGNLIKLLDTAVGDCNGLSSPTPIDVNEDQRVDYVYAGDLKGNLWKFDLTSADHSDWNFAYTEGVPKPLFQAKGPGGTTQPITTKPDVMEHCERNGYLVAFGTGKYLADEDLADTSTQSLYGVWDYGDDADDTEYLGSFNRGSTPQLSNLADNVELLQQEVYDWRIEGSVELRTLTDYVPSWGTVADGTADQLPDPGSSDPNETVHAGWYFDLPDPGERIVSDVSIREEKLLAITFVPEESVCGSGGYSWLHEGDACSGGRLDEPQFDINGDSVIDASDLINVQIGVDEFGNPIYLSVAPTQIKAWGKGRLQFPTILRAGGEEIKYLSSSTGEIETVTESAITLGISYWIEFD
jgi:type IV pilus assembly protein PilY1